MKYLLLIAFFVPGLSMAGPEERAKMAELKATATEAEAAYKKSCGCALSIQITESVKTLDDIYQAKNTVSSVKDSVESHCIDAESKKAYCQMKTLEVSKSAASGFKFASGKGTATFDDQSAASFTNISAELDK